MKGLVRKLAVLAAGACWPLLGVWLAGRVVTDRWLWSQYAFWVPTAAVLAVGAGLLAVSWGLARLGGRDRRTRQWSAARLRTSAAIAMALAGAYMGLVEWRMQGYLLRPAAAGRGAPGLVRILNWNVTRIDESDRIARAVAAANPDVAVLVNLTVGDRQGLFKSFGEPLALVQDAGVTVMSSLPIIRHGAVGLGLAGLPPGLGHPYRPDQGRALYFELDTTERLGRTSMVWVVDMPSDWRLSRRAMATGAAAAIAAWEGAQVNHDRAGQLTFQTGGPGFPAPDIVMGDFNTPRGSGSLSTLAPGMSGAYDQGGAGRAASWPRQWPLVHIDQMFLAPWLRARRYEVMDPGAGFHRMQVGEIGKAGR